MEKAWAGLPYYPISHFYAKKFGGKVYKIPVSVVDNCPNRMGLKGMETCIFCDVWGSAANAESFSMDLASQIEKYKTSIGNRFKSKRFLVYFQAYTNTFTKLSNLEKNFETALSFDFVKGLVIGTRPDCISPAVLKLWQTCHEKSFVAVELGVQSFFDDQLLFLKRGHTRAQSIEAIHKIKNNTQVDLGVHLIFGLPNETHEQIRESAEIINHLPVDNVKLHHLHVLKDTPLEKIYHQGEFTPIALEDYAERVRIFLQHLSPRIAVQRLAAFSSRWDELVAPAWTADKMRAHQFIIDNLRNHRAYQSELYYPQNEEEANLCLKLKNQSRSLLELQVESAKNLLNNLPQIVASTNSGLLPDEKTV
jgi:radical SAM protein (TIGR01212 family)